MEDETSRKTQKMKALGRWENEGGMVTNDVPPINRDHSTDVDIRNSGCQDRRELRQVGRD